METTPSECRVLVVDDDPVVRRAVTTLFARVGYPVAGSHLSTDVADRMQQTDYHLVVSDFDMPGINGYQLACRIKTSDSRTKVVLMTGSGLSQASAYAGCREIDAWLFKPFGIQAISEVMEALHLPNAFAGSRFQRRSHAA